MRLRKVERKTESFEYYRFQLISKSLETLKWHFERKQEHRSKVEFVTTARAEKFLKDVFHHLKARAARRVSHARLQKKLEKTH
jgi:hypothetical protein